MRVIHEIRRRAAPSVPLLDMVEYFQADFAMRGIDLYHLRTTDWGKEGNRLAGELITDAAAQAWLRRDTTLPPDLREARSKRLSEYEPDVDDATIVAFVDGLADLEDTEAPRCRFDALGAKN